MNFDRILLYVISILLIGLLIVTAGNKFLEKKIAYVDIAQLADKYQFKKDLEKEASNNLYQIKGVIDSLKMARKLTGSPAVDSQIAHAEYAFNQYYTQSNQDISKKVWERLNPVVGEFGKEKNLNILLGATGTGTLLYADDAANVTDELINYVNVKYGTGN